VPSKRNTERNPEYQSRCFELQSSQCCAQHPYSGNTALQQPHSCYPEAAECGWQVAQDVVGCPCTDTLQFPRMQLQLGGNIPGAGPTLFPCLSTAEHYCTYKPHRDTHLAYRSPPKELLHSRSCRQNGCSCCTADSRTIVTSPPGKALQVLQ